MTNKYNTFVDVEHKLLRTWNRAAMFFNIMQDKNKEEAVNYLRQFTKDEINDVYSMFEEVKLNGYTATRTYINRVVQNETVQ